MTDWFMPPVNHLQAPTEKMVLPGAIQMKHQGVAVARVHGNGIGKIAEALTRIKVGVRSPVDMGSLFSLMPVDEIGVRMPDDSVVIRDGSWLSHDADRRLLMQDSRKQRNRVQKRPTLLFQELKMKMAVLIWRYIPKDALVGKIGAARVIVDIEPVQYRISIRGHSKSGEVWSDG